MMEEGAPWGRWLHYPIRVEWLFKMASFNNWRYCESVQRQISHVVGGLERSHIRTVLNEMRKKAGLLKGEDV